MTAPLLFLDVETTGLDLAQDDVWEVAAVLRDPIGAETEFHRFLQHRTWRADALPDPFLLDRRHRYDPDVAVNPAEAMRDLETFATGGTWRPHLVGAVPSFDDARLGRILDLCQMPRPWHYHLIDVETLAVGYLKGYDDAAGEPGALAPPWDSESLSRAMHVDPARFARHTAMGDVRWAMALYDAVMGGPA